MSKYGEPWRIVESPHVWSTVGRIDRADEIAIWPIIDSMADGDGKVEIALGLADENNHIERAVACVNACSGIEHPEAIAERIAALETALKCMMQEIASRHELVGDLRMTGDVSRYWSSWAGAEKALQKGTC